MAFVVCALIMYMLWWNKPFDVQRRTTVSAITYEEKLKVEFTLPQYKNHGVPDLTFEAFLLVTLGGIGRTKRDELKKIVRAFGNILGNIFGKSSPIDPPRELAVSIAFYAMTTVFSAFHIGAWNWDFPSSTVQTMWRSLGVLAISTGPFTLFFVSVAVITNLDNYIHPIFLFGVLCVLFLVYVISHLGLIVLIFYCFSSMPAGVYETVDWTKFLPYFSWKSFVEAQLCFTLNQVKRL